MICLYRYKENETYPFNIEPLPMFDPNVSGYVLSIVITPIPTNGVRVDVKIELLWTRIVMAAPKRIAT